MARHPERSSRTGGWPVRGEEEPCGPARRRSHGLYRRSHCLYRRGFTLLELLVVLAVLAVVAALSWPAVRGLLEKSQLQNAAKHLRAALVRARLQAMESGTVRQFRYQPGSGRFEISVAQSLDAAQSAGSEAEARDEPGHEGTAAQTLPGGAVFEETAAAADRLDAAAWGEARGEGAWSTPVFFYPNGRTANARFPLAGHRGYAIEVRLRGVAGTVTIGPLEQAESEP